MTRGPPTGRRRIASFSATCNSDSGNSGGTFTVRAQHADGYVRGEVEDQGSDWPGELSAATRPHGPYLLLNLASACGVERISRAHLVWFRLDYPEDLT